MKQKGKSNLIVVLVSINFFFSYCSIAQSAKITVQGGGSVYFIINSLNKYNDGLTLDSWTKLKLTLDDPGLSGWQLTVRAGSATIQSEGEAPDLDLSTIELRAEVVSTNDPTISNISPIVLSDNPSGDIILSGSKVDDLEVVINIDYDCGTKPENKLLGKEADFYFIDLYFQLSSVP